MKKKIYALLSVMIVIGLVACGKNKKNEMMTIGGVEYPAIFVRSGYYFDKATFSETTLKEYIEKIEVVEKPKSLGEVEMPDLSTIELVAKKVDEITPADVEAEIEHLRDKEMAFVPIKGKREAMMTDKVNIDFDGYLNDVAFEGGSMKGYDLILGSGAFIPGFEEQVVGHTAGKKFSINVTFPEEYQAAELAGKEVRFDIIINSIEEPKTPEVDENFVKAHTTKGSTTVEEFNEEIKQKLIEKNEFLMNQDISFQLYNILLDKCKFDPTEEALAWQFSEVIGQLKSQAMMSGMSVDDFLLSNGANLTEAFEEIKSTMPQYIQQQMLMDTLINKYKVKIKEDDVKIWFEKMANAEGYGNEISYEEYIKRIGYDMIAEFAKQEMSMLAATKECKIIEEEAEE